MYIRHSTDGRSNAENPTSEEGRFEYRIFDIRLCSRSNRKNPTNKANRIQFSTFDPTECTRLLSEQSLVTYIIFFEISDKSDQKVQKKVNYLM